MRDAEQYGLPYLFKLRLTANVKKIDQKYFFQRWLDGCWGSERQVLSYGWKGRHETLRLEGWSRQRGRRGQPRSYSIGRDPWLHRFTREVCR